MTQSSPKSEPFDNNFVEKNRRNLHLRRNKIQTTIQYWLTNHRGFLFVLLTLFGVELGSCQANQGWIELDWVFVDKSLEQVFPGRNSNYLCELTGTELAGDPSTLKYKLQVRLNRYPCSENMSPEKCLQVPDYSTDLFRCNRARGTAEQVASGDDGYLIEVQIIADPERGSRFMVSPNCIAVPGPRFRRVLGGAITDLSVYQFVIHYDTKPGMVFSECRQGFDIQ